MQVELLLDDKQARNAFTKAVRSAVQRWNLAYSYPLQVAIAASFADITQECNKAGLTT